MYQPVMSEENVRRLYRLKLKKGRPMTKLINQILNEYFEQRQKEAEEGGETECMSVKFAETHSKSNGRETEGITTTSDTDTAPSAALSTTP
jgi:hypothetical protein